MSEVTARPLKPGRYLVQQLKEHGFEHRIAPSKKKYYVNKEGYQVVVGFGRLSEGEKEIRLLNPQGFTLFANKQIYPDQLLSWSKMKREDTEGKE